MILRNQPPLELVVKFLEGFGLKSLHDTSWFSKDNIQLDKAEIVLPELEPYYMPCKAHYIHDELSVNSVITILRQLIKAHGVKIYAREKARCGVKTVWYQLIPARQTLTEDAVIEFT